MLSVLGATLPSQQIDNTQCNPVYETANSILTQGQPNTSKRVLGLLTSMLRAAPQSEARRARDLIRTSGCLNTMSYMFLSTKTMSEEWWSTLCDCLAELFRHSEENQNYCSHLIPKCIQLTEGRNPSLLKVLHNLLLHNNRNVKLFVKNKGLSIFTSSSIQESYIMQILTIATQDEKATNLLKRNEDLIQFLLHVEDKHDRSSKMVEWTSIILFNMASHTAGYEKISKRDKMYTFENLNKIQSNMDISQDLSVSFLFKSNWDNKVHTVFRDFMTENDKRESFFLKCANDARKSNLNSSASSGSRTSFDFPSENKFKPRFMSTPKHKHILSKERNTGELSSLQQSSRVRKAANVNKPKVKVSSQGKKHKLSLSACVFHSMTDSCASIFKTLGNILFKNKIGSQKDIIGTNIKFREKAPSYSCTKNMALRDVFNSNPRERKLCGCNEAVHRKDFDDQQKQIVKTLKTGIYLYGCDFKKISKVMWPHDKQMTPKVLYDIYRKCIAK